MRSPQRNWWCVLLMVFIMDLALAEAEVGGEIVLLDIEGGIGPASSDYLSRSLELAESRQAQLVIIRMDTPGGLDTSMRAMVKKILASPVPVAVYVAPSGARAASAGTYILYASHISAMAPGTNLGAATPVQLGGIPGGADRHPDQTPKPNGEPAGTAEPNGDPSTKKLVNDAAAYLRGLAQMRGRNEDWAEMAVREGVSLSAEEALKMSVIDLIASDVPDLTRRLDGYRVQTQSGSRSLRTTGAPVNQLAPDWRNQILAIISNPNVAYVLMLLGIYGLIHEFSNPGMMVPGVVGAICLLLAFYAFHVLPVNYAGFALMLLGLALIVGEAFVPSFGALGIGGGIAFVVGSIILIDTDAPGYGISLPLIISLAVIMLGIVFLVVSLAVRSRGRPVVSGREELQGAKGRVIDSFEETGMVLIHGEVWRARCNRPVAAGQQVWVIGREGLILEVSPVPTKEE
ncbi:MAG: nodulation protein NfeD [Gammaproteobacteria bacterium]|nr:nodulation protein NfeD [Gammaproteobacteria bacterium]